MTCHPWFVSQRLGFVLRCSDQDEERVFLRHVSTCPECVREVRELERQVGWLAMAVETVEVPPGFRQRARAQAMRRP